MGISLRPIYDADLAKLPELPILPYYEDHALSETMRAESKAAWDAWQLASRPYYDDFHVGGYFSFNWGSAETIISVLAMEGILDESPEPEWPDALTAEVSSDDYAEGRVEGSDTLWDFLAQTPYPGGFYAYKFGSNDGWIVTPDECRAISAAVRRYLAEDDRRDTPHVLAFLTRFADYCAWCVERGGFRVN